MKYVLFALLLACGFTASAQTIPLRIVSYNLLNFPNGRNDCGSGNVNLPNRSDSLRKIMQYLKPDIFVGCEIQTEAGCDSVLNRALNVFGTTHYQRAQWVNNSFGGDLQNMLFYNAAKLTLKEQRIVQTSPRDISHYILYVKDATLPQHHDTCFIEVFMCHLKAGSASADLSDRAAQTQLLRTVLDGRPQGRHLFVCGDLNTYRSTEAGYQNLVSGGTNFLKDPLNMPGNWTTNSTFAAIHTQSPRASGSTDCGVTGGLDDRFDHIIVSQNVMNGTNLLQYNANSYKAIGNDGNHYNQSILTGSNSQYPDSVVRALYYASDHLPVKLDMTATIPTNFGLNLTLSFASSNCQSGGTSVTVQPNLGQAPYTYQWSANAGSQTTATANDLQGGSYCVTVTDNNGLTDQVCFEVETMSPISANGFDGMDYGTCNGQSFVAVSGGNPPYTYQWDDPLNQTTSTATNLCAGTYSCVITDQYGCSLMVQTTVFSNTTSLTELFAGADFTLFPNPATESVTLRCESGFELGTMEFRILSVSGELVQAQTVDFSNTDQVTIPLSDLQNGIYFVELEKEGVSTQRMIVKQ
ncbi:T9SS type A sorting domain-containing protein [Fluviicola chungangensis]|uniref:T9SS type A sorting domain-containing protein n=1 Tax=Fluviicola chungangensis TaxID=2597671 RepID=A0A556MJM6_9FLAO|nr:T9SS type A sorting domain-containing protein [Fluviicola chungangensis]TSJ40117.1 T9SS type A sorting domain-containing protein [Fluviicola chungangensis]